MISNAFKKLYHHGNLIFIEIIVFFSLLILFFIVNYLIFWQPTLNHYLSTNKWYHQKKIALFNKKMQFTQEKEIISSLQKWRNKNINFYNIISVTPNVNQQLSLLTKLIQQAQFTILQITKMTPINHSKTKCELTLTTTGQFINLFSLITTLNHFAIPFTLSALAIDHHQLKMSFILRECNA